MESNRIGLGSTKEYKGKKMSILNMIEQRENINKGDNEAEESLREEVCKWNIASMVKD